MKTNFDSYLDEQLRDPEFADRFARAGEAWDIALQIAAARKQAGLSQRELAERVGTTQQQISRLESPNYEGHSLSMLRRVAQALDARIRFSFEPIVTLRVAEEAPVYGTKKSVRPRLKRGTKDKPA
ncbi:MAG: helix-turn-helix transcriptional regulator [Terrimicrobiaceae bacterium]|nr:helix-turn-helix transcriptional regulator [Terrimicrobiaceae bacterium]